MKAQGRHPRLDATQAPDAPPVDPERVAAVGYCFGGRCVLDLVRGGGAAGVRGVVSLHGVLDAQPLPAGVARIEAAVLLCHGDADPFTPPAALDACVAQLRAHCAQWQLNTYGGAPHAWTNPAQVRVRVRVRVTLASTLTLTLTLTLSNPNPNAAAQLQPGLRLRSRRGRGIVAGDHGLLGGGASPLEQALATSRDPAVVCKTDVFLRAIYNPKIYLR